MLLSCGIGLAGSGAFRVAESWFATEPRQIPSCRGNITSGTGQVEMKNECFSVERAAKRSMARWWLVFLLASLASPAWALPARLGDLNEDGVMSILDVVLIMNHLNGQSPLAENLRSFADIDRDGAVGASDVDSVVAAVVAGLQLAEIDFNPTLDVANPFTDQSPYTVVGSNFPRTRVRVSWADGTMEGLSDAEGRFAIDVALNEDRFHSLFVSGFDAQGVRLRSLPLEVLRDSEAPSIQLVFPQTNWITSDADVVVSGRVSDPLSGFLGMEVNVNEVPAAVYAGSGEAGSFMSQPVGLSLGENVIEIEALDAVGNRSSLQVTVMRVATGSPRLERAAGDRQSGNVGEFLDTALSARILGPDGLPMAGKPVVFDVVGGIGTVASLSGSTEGATVQALADADGLASVRWRLSTIAGKGNHVVAARTVGVDQPLYFTASADPGPMVRLNQISGDGQAAVIGTELAAPLRVWVNDGGNALSGREVLFEVVDGDGKVNGASTAIVNSGPAGFAEVSASIGSVVGLHQVAASVTGESGANVTFRLHGVAPGMEATALTGLVMSPFFEPVPGARIELLIEGVRHGPVTTSAAGAFQIENISAGAAELQLWLAEGNSSQATPEVPLVTRSLFLESGIENPLPQPIILPVTLNRTTVAYDGTQPLELRLGGAEEFSLTIPAGSLQARDGRQPSPENPFALSLTQVPVGNLPMRAPFGETPRLAWLLEPADVVFTAVPDLVIPDLAGLAGNASLGLFGLDERLRRFSRSASSEATGSPAVFRLGPADGDVPSGFAFANAGFQGGLATVTNGDGDGAPVE